ncbi:hypothetical protein ACE10Z_28110 [Bradyrhizobium sp. Pha-3]|uniref:hypothetical protein n=1 Tax=Bradyrhizobium sp. Pha-3 TaxID=208375 RepID=UPI0035D51DC5
MESSESSFFRFVWRFNALAIAGATIVCIVLGAYVGLAIFRQETGVRRVTNVVNIDEKDKASDVFALGSPTTIAAAPYVRVPLYRGQAYAASYYSKRSDQNIVNYLFLNTVTNENRWLFERTNQLIIDSQVLFNKAKSAPDDARAAVGIFYVVVEKDSNGDNRLTDKDAVALAASAVDGTAYRKLIEGIEQLYSVQQIADDKVLVLYQKNQQTISELYGLPSMVRLTQTNIPKINMN